MKNVLEEFANIEKNVRRNNIAILGLIGLMAFMIIVFSITAYKLSTYFASHEKILEADGAVRHAAMVTEKEAIEIEIKDFMCSFYNTFYSFTQYNIDSCINLGMYKGDESLRDLYFRDTNSGWYNTIIQEGITQTSIIDPTSFNIDVTTYPYHVSVRGLMTCRKELTVRHFILNGSCTLERVKPDWPKNPHGFFIHGWVEDKREIEEK
jgi:hypothetical protein